MFPTRTERMLKLAQTTAERNKSTCETTNLQDGKSEKLGLKESCSILDIPVEVSNSIENVDASIGLTAGPEDICSISEAVPVLINNTDESRDVAVDLGGVCSILNISEAVPNLINNTDASIDLDVDVCSILDISEAIPNFINNAEVSIDLAVNSGGVCSILNISDSKNNECASKGLAVEPEDDEVMPNSINNVESSISANNTSCISAVSTSDSSVKDNPCDISDDSEVDSLYEPNSRIPDSDSNSNSSYDSCIPDNHCRQEVNSAMTQDSIRPKKGRKRKHNIQTFSTRKKLKDSNLEHFTVAGKFIKPKEFNNFKCNCTNNCHEKVSQSLRKRLFEKFWDLGSYNTQTSFIVANIEETDIKRRRGSSNKRSYSRTLNSVREICSLSRNVYQNICYFY
ncbi:uncharacterized protein LOC120351446 [Nilaparvata lugens]|uniref:uncharacterized protein LOC120351446 n=1 Tax=Nilaparvata lugens TaxID=108931 RepID=UPI00193D4F03|nr:uncharacterized protein LOC120351446 [Nilaparvata lugens]